MTKAIVIGGGVVGVLSAYYLSERGLDVTLIERREDLGAEASAANANQLSYSHIFPPVAPFTLPKVPGILLGRDPALKVRSLLDPTFWVWVLRAAPYLLSKTCYRKVSEEIKRIHEESRSLMTGFVARHPISFSHVKAGRVMIYEKESDLDHSFDSFAHHGLGAYVRRLSYAQAIALEPALAHRKPFAGALQTPDDETGDCAAFVLGVEDVLISKGVEIIKGRTVRTCVRQGEKIEAVILENGDTLRADVFVVTAGVWARNLLRGMGIHVPIYPVKGYTYEIPIKTPSSMPFRASIVDTGLKMVFTPLDHSLKVSNGIFFIPMNRPDDEKFLAHIRKAAASIYPGIDFSQAVLRSGYRPWTPDSLPIVERRLDNLYLNVGHGMLGWTMAHGTAKRLADLVGSHL